MGNNHCHRRSSWYCPLPAKNNWVKYKEGFLLLWISLLSLPAYVGGSTASSTHYLWVPMVLSIFAGYGIFSVHEMILKRFSLSIVCI